jgi:hypothetical protein
VAYGMHSRKRMFERCRQATQQSTCKKETRRACGAGLSVSEELAMLGSHSAGRNTVHDTTVPAAAVICNLLAQQHAHHAFFGVLVRSNRLALCSLYMAESECCTNPVYAAVIGTCNCTTKLVSQRLHASDGQSVRTVELAACARLYPRLHKPCACSNSTTASRQQRAATEQFQPHIMQAFASTPIRMCWFSQRSCSLLHPSPGCVGMLHKPQHAAATTTTGRQQNRNRCNCTALVMCPCKLVYICLLVPVY